MENLGRLGGITEVVARLERWKAKALIISTRIRTIACTYTRVNLVLQAHTHARPRNVSSRTRDCCARTRAQHTFARPVFLGQTPVMGFCKLEQVIPLADERSGCVAALPSSVFRVRVCSFTYPSRVLQLTGDFCGKNHARVISGSYVEDDQASLLCIYLCRTVA